ncbi:flavin reductase family protein (plasmid) [Parasedimentitalea marina]|uniref:Flavin reductase family protein n=1 Tax=Parasedimentitalea marina TaxID=2483033 RepID=A0A3T0NA38_9RHOB|nr:flavin reductase family protein [Parasedimentitalea marina]AZV80910.1 flavin reductase family protein [Parasedimentitalea marina]
MFYKPDEGHGLAHNPIAACVSPRPIGWISTISATGHHNLAPFSYFNLVHNFPPTVMFSCNGLKPDESPKDSWVNARDTGEFVYNVATFPLREALNQSSTAWDIEVDEFEETGLKTLPSELVKPMRVAASPIQFECRTIEVKHLPTNRPENPNTVVFGEVVGVHIDEACLTDGMVDYDKVQHISRLGYLDFATIGSRFQLPRVFVKREQD